MKRCPSHDWPEPEWLALALVGYQPATDDPEGPLLEMRDCPHCHSTVARHVPSLRYLVREANKALRVARLATLAALPHRLCVSCGRSSVVPGRKIGTYTCTSCGAVWQPASG